MRERIARLAEPQLGVVLGSQLITDGACRGSIRHAVNSGRLEELFSGAFRQPSGTRASVEQELMAAVLMGGDGTAVSHATAAALFGFPGFARRPLHVSVPDRRKLTLPEAYVVHRPTREFESLLLGKIRTTTLPRTIIDCAESLRGAPLEIMLDDAHHRFERVAERIRRELATLKHLTSVARG